MKKILLIPDSFKGTMTSADICKIMKHAIKKHYPDATIISVPVADGGEGTVEAFLSAVGGKQVELAVKGPHFENIETFYGVLPEGTVIVEMASAAGLPLVGDNKNPERTTTFGVGELIKHAITNGAKKIILGLGGSATNDGGCGAAAALGAKFYNNSGTEFIPTGGMLTEIARIDVAPLRQTLHGVEMLAMCDIDNPLCGKSGAAAIFAPQKGADMEMVMRLDKALLHLAQVVQHDLGTDILDIRGGGAAGGMGGGSAAFFNAKLKMGIDIVLDTVKFDELLIGASLVFTGEGKIDAQSLSGKVVYGVAQKCKKHGVPVIVVAGDIGSGIEMFYNEGVTAVFSTNRMAIPFEQAKQHAAEDLYNTMDNILRFSKI